MKGDIVQRRSDGAHAEVLEVLNKDRMRVRFGVEGSKGLPPGQRRVATVEIAAFRKVSK